jgi:hypothetical protein
MRGGHTYRAAHRNTFIRELKVKWPEATRYRLRPEPVIRPNRSRKWTSEASPKSPESVASTTDVPASSSIVGADVIGADTIPSGNDLPNSTPDEPPSGHGTKPQTAEESLYEPSVVEDSL